MTDFKDAASALAEITKGVAELATTDGWTNYLKFASKFHNYSMNNLMLIAIQSPEATQFAGYKTWQTMGRQVRKGEAGIRILAPMVGKDKDTGDSRVYGFRTVSVFDVAQTDGEALPELDVKRLEGQAPDEIMEALVSVANDLGYSVEVTDQLANGVNGETRFASKEVLIRSDNSPAQQVKTMAHELGHVLLHADQSVQRDRAQKELEAESVAFVVCRAIGIQSDDYSFGYVLSWAGGEDEANRLMKDSASRIVKAADQIINAVDVEPAKALLTA